MATDRDLVDERERRLIDLDNAYPDVGPGIEFGGLSRAIAIDQLKRERKIASDYTD